MVALRGWTWRLSASTWMVRTSMLLPLRTSAKQLLFKGFVRVLTHQKQFENTAAVEILNSETIKTPSTEVSARITRLNDTLIASGMRDGVRSAERFLLVSRDTKKEEGFVTTIAERGC